ncbi:hypothetical protein TWF281_005588 [Arthrobotrys megalospora]
MLNLADGFSLCRFPGLSASAYLDPHLPGSGLSIPTDFTLKSSYLAFTWTLVYSDYCTWTTWISGPNFGTSVPSTSLDPRYVDYLARTTWMT